MAIEKSLFAAPLGEDVEVVEQLEIAIEPEIMTLEDGGVEITLVPDMEDSDIANAPFEANLAEYLDDGQLNELSGDLIGAVDGDIGSRRDWAETYVKGLEVLGFSYEDRTEPWENACGVYSTVLAEAAIRFQAEAMSETLPAAGPVKTQILGEMTKDKEDAALRVKTDMNYAGS